MSSKPETVFRQNKVLPFLQTLRNSCFFPIQQQSIAGDADYLGCMSGRFVWLELKKLKGKAKKLQLAKAQAVTKAGGVALQASPENWDEIKLKLTELNGGYYES